MKVLILRGTVIGPNSHGNKGDVKDLPDDTAMALIHAGAAEKAADDAEVKDAPTPKKSGK